METLLGVIVSIGRSLLCCTISQAAYVYNLQKNIESLNTKWNELQSKEKDVQENILTAENTGVKKRTNVVNDWLQDFQNLKQKMLNDIPNPQQIQSNQCLNGYCPKNCVSSYKLGKKIVKMLDETNELLSKAETMQIVINQPPKPIEKIPCVETIGMDLMVHNIWNSLQDDKVGIIGLYGMGGVGKTTLMKRIHNELGERDHSFDLVLWVVVSKESQDINRIMNDISSLLGIDKGYWNRSTQAQRVAKIYERLKVKKFVLMLDDLWEKLELQTIGVPDPKESNNKSKVVFTTRSVDVCGKMKAQKKFEVECLSKEKSFDLFCINVGEEALRCNTKIREIAREMSDECGGLPLALNVVGSAMAGVECLDSWIVAQRDLKSSQDKVFRHLEFSYDRLPKEVHKLCFLYCALYPEDFKMDVDKLIDRWIAEGFLGKYDMISVHDIDVSGKAIIHDLKCACLFQEHVLNYKYFNSKRQKRIIKMHDLIRDMALWLSRDKNENKAKIVVEGEAFSMSEMDSKRLNDVERISIILGTEDFVKKEWQVPACQNLKTLCVRLNLDATNFLFLKSLRVLDISSNGSIETLSSEIGELINLEFMNLSGTEVYCLPIEMKKLKNLRVLLMEDMTRRYVIDDVNNLEVIESLERLKVFRFSRMNLTRFRLDDGQKEIPFLEKLESLPKLEELFVSLKSISGMLRLLNSTKLQSCSRHIKLSCREGLEESDTLEMSSLLASMSEMKYLECIHLIRVKNLMDGSPVKCNLAELRQVSIYDCNSITHLTWLRYAPLLKFLDVSFCISIEHLVKDDENEETDHSKSNNDISIFENLEKLRLEYMPKLVSIHKRPLPFSHLKSIVIHACPNLKKLPFSNRFASNNNLIAIQGEDYWWESLEWDDTTIQNLLHSKLRCDRRIPNLMFFFLHYPLIG